MVRVVRAVRVVREVRVARVERVERVARAVRVARAARQLANSVATRARNRNSYIVALQRQKYINIERFLYVVVLKIKS